ncbi:putative serine/threonine protein kinase [Saccharomycopsis crataegensis]|uniref:non-specific serine/threonine protein kinase n=1 Tax=Saccharomycopsis crataegensis TaxID=43959 RepID=A0AAV5QHT7_9ASCO|nr:putative serine/threonine protein kinase [Saccharomycopsis crataegensis]
MTTSASIDHSSSASNGASPYHNLISHNSSSFLHSISFSKKNKSISSFSNLSISHNNEPDCAPQMPANPRRRSFFGLSMKKSDSDSSSQSSIVLTDSRENAHHAPDNGSCSTVSEMDPSHHRKYSDHSIHSPKLNGGHNTNHYSMVQLRKFFKRSSRDHSRHSRKNSHTSVGDNNETTPKENGIISNKDIIKKDPLENLLSKYGKVGKILGAGAGGSVRLLTRESDNVTFAVKEFRAKRPNESTKEYAKKCTAEFCIGSTLNHPNIIHTFDIINDTENSHYYEIMEYCPIDFFEVVMSGKMNRNEINCCFKQLSEGVKYLHSIGLAHRDLKLDNCVLTKDGVLKIIDFGSAIVFKYPFDTNIVKCHGIVGSDPYLAPEVLDTKEKYDPRFVDIWSIAIIYCCMTLKRFPWKIPEQADNSFKLYSMPDEEPHDYVKSAADHKILLAKRREERLKKLREVTEASHNEPSETKEPVVCANADKEKSSETTGSAAKEHKSTSSSPSKQSLNTCEQVTIKVPCNTKPADDQNSNNCDDNKSNKSSDLNNLPNRDDSTERRIIETNNPTTVPVVVNKSKSSEKRDKEHCQEKKAEESHQANAKHAAHPGHHQLKGPYRLMRILPHASRPLISRMLAIDVTKRATMEDIFADEWFKHITGCSADIKNGKVISGIGHSHTIMEKKE